MQKKLNLSYNSSLSPGKGGISIGDEWVKEQKNPAQTLAQYNYELPFRHSGHISSAEKLEKINQDIKAKNSEREAAQIECSASRGFTLSVNQPHWNLSLGQ